MAEEGSTTGVDPGFEVKVDDRMYRDPSGAWLNGLLAIYGENTGNPSDPISSSGSTTAELLPNTVNFGPNLPADKYMGHTESECKRPDVFEWDLQMFTEMLVRISNLESRKRPLTSAPSRIGARETRSAERAVSSSDHR